MSKKTVRARATVVHRKPVQPKTTGAGSKTPGKKPPQKSNVSEDLLERAIPGADFGLIAENRYKSKVFIEVLFLHIIYKKPQKHYRKRISAETRCAIIQNPERLMPSEKRSGKRSFSSAALLGAGTSRCSATDKFDQTKGEQLALKAAMQLASDVLNREVRSAVWKQFQEGVKEQI